MVQGRNDIEIGRQLQPQQKSGGAREGLVEGGWSHHHRGCQQQLTTAMGYVRCATTGEGWSTRGLGAASIGKGWGMEVVHVGDRMVRFFQLKQ